MSMYSYTWAVEEFDGTRWRVKEMDTEISDIKNPIVFGEAKRAELAEVALMPLAGSEGVNSEEFPSPLRLNISAWGPYAPKRRKAAAQA